MSNVDRLPYVEAELNYLGADQPSARAITPMSRTPDDPPSNMPLEPHRMQIHDLRPIAARTVARRAGLRAGRAAQRGARFLGR